MWRSSQMTTWSCRRILTPRSDTHQWPGGDCQTLMKAQLILEPSSLRFSQMNRYSRTWTCAQTAQTSMSHVHGSARTAAGPSPAPQRSSTSRPIRPQWCLYKTQERTHYNMHLLFLIFIKRRPSVKAALIQRVAQTPGFWCSRNKH